MIMRQSDFDTTDYAGKSINELSKRDAERKSEMS